IDEFRKALEKLADAGIDETDLVPTLRLDCELPLDSVDVELVGRISGLQPHGIGNPEPVFGAMGVTVVQARRVGRDQRHLQMKLEGNGAVIPAIWWGGGGVDGIDPGSRVDVAFNLMLDNRSGLPRLKIRDVHPCSEG
ncbi:MAG: hypothetical protein GXP54_03070, partial [Deltaproteobacteria bacterium]|nr:hypothetical protein [Deltaproteobacteria bacterium]